jgi:hypothetical protein
MPGVVARVASALRATRGDPVAAPDSVVADHRLLVSGGCSSRPQRATPPVMAPCYDNMLRLTECRG